MSAAGSQLDVKKRNANRKVAGACLAFFAGMVGMAYAAVPLYDLFCRVTGFGGTPQRVEQYSQTILDRDITIRFDANVTGGLGWDFRPAQRDTKIKIGETALVSYAATNLDRRTTSGKASFNVTPELAGAYFMKVECFCFTDTELEPGETMDMPVVFYVDPEIVNSRELANVKTITLSYTFFPTVESGRPLAARDTGKTATSTAGSEFGG